MSKNQLPDASLLPRFCDMGNFMRLQKKENADGLDVGILGIPFDTASSFRTGSRFGPSSIRKISTMIKPNNIIMGVNIVDILNIADLGDVPIVPGYIKESYDAIYKSISEVLDAGAVPLCLGGDHSITLGELRAVYKKHGKVSLIHFDSHLDLGKSVFGKYYTHGTPFRRALEEGLIDPSTSIQIGIRGSMYDLNDIKIAEDLGFEVITAHKLHKMTEEELGEKIKERVGQGKAFLTFDIDFVDPAYAPGTGTPEVGGFTSHETLSYIQQLKDINFIGCDIVEVAPDYDCSEITAYLAASIGFEFMSILACKKQCL